MAISNNIALLTDVCVIVTYRCHMHCMMCNIWQHHTAEEDEIGADELKKLPDNLSFINVTGGEPFLRKDLDEILQILTRKAKRVVISTSGYHYDRILKIVPQFRNVGVRVSIEGLSCKNDQLRGRAGGFDRGLKTLLGLKRLGLKDIGFGITVSDSNSSDMLWLYELGKAMNMEFSTAAYHNSYYFHKTDNLITNIHEVSTNFLELANRQMQEMSPKSWFRALFNLGLIRYISHERRMLPCEAGTANIFIDPHGDLFPCNGMEEKYWKMSMGNIRDAASFADIWFSSQAEEARAKVLTCPKNCWMVGTASPVMHKYKGRIFPWVIRQKLKSLFGKKIDASIPCFDVGQDPRQGDLRESGCRHE